MKNILQGSKGRSGQGEERIHEPEEGTTEILKSENKKNEEK